MRRSTRFWTTALGAAALAATYAVAQTQPATLFVEVFVRGEKRDAKLTGRLTQHDDQHLTIDAPGGPRDLTWDQLTPASGFALRARLIDKTIAADWLELGRWGWQRGVEASARTAFQQATRLDGSLAPRVSAIVATPSGGKLPATVGDGRRPPPATKPVAVEPAAGAPSQPMQPGRRRGERPVTRYDVVTPEQNAAAIAAARKQKSEVEAKLELKLAEVESDHFLIFTDWQPAELGFLKEKCEGAYRIVAKEFNRSPKENVFVGKLPIFMFAEPATFRKYAKEVDDIDLPPTVLGYFQSVGTMGHMAMWKPGIGVGIGAGGTLDDAIRNWGRTLVHEFCHAFVHRYRTDVFIPRWLNEGTAELISEGVLPSNNYYAIPRVAAQEHVDVSVLFDDAHLPTGEAYPVMMTLVETLVRRDRVAFLAFFNDLKDGVDPEDALRKRYALDYAGLAAAWQAYARGLR